MGKLGENCLAMLENVNLELIFFCFLKDNEMNLFDD